ncbi:MAG: rhomboid family intramembrane serine protease [Gammaproteobacteria bacterium]
MFPLRDENPTLDTSVATFAIIGLNAAAWLLLQGLGSEPTLSRSVCQYGAIPGQLLGIFPPGAAIELGPGDYCPVGDARHWWSPLSSMFMHGGWFHILGNMWFLYIFGDNVEDSMGPARFVIFYLLCGFAAVAAQILADPASPIPMVGASGAIGGVMGAYAVLYPRIPVHLLVILGFYVGRVAVPAFVMLGYWFLLQLLGGLPALQSEGGGVAFWAHVGGFLAGVVLIHVFRDPGRVAAHRARLLSHWPGR